VLFNLSTLHFNFLLMSAE